MMISNELILGYSNMLKQSELLSKDINDTNGLMGKNDLDGNECYQHFSPKEGVSYSDRSNGDAILTSQQQPLDKLTLLQSALLTVLKAGVDVNSTQLDYLEKITSFIQSNNEFNNSCNEQLFFINLANEIINNISQTSWIELERLRIYFECTVGINKNDSIRYAKLCINNDIHTYQSLLMNFNNSKYVRLLSHFSKEHLYLIEMHSKSTTYLSSLINSNQIFTKDHHYPSESINLSMKTINTSNYTALSKHYYSNEDDCLSYKHHSLKDLIDNYQLETGLLWHDHLQNKYQHTIVIKTELPPTPPCYLYSNDESGIIIVSCCNSNSSSSSSIESIQHSWVRTKVSGESLRTCESLSASSSIGKNIVVVDDDDDVGSNISSISSIAIVDDDRINTNISDHIHVNDESVLKSTFIHTKKAISNFFLGMKNIS